MRFKNWLAVALVAGTLGTRPLPAVAASVTVAVDPRVELASILSALEAGGLEADRASAGYLADVRTTFASHASDSSLHALQEWWTTDRGSAGTLARVALTMSSDLKTALPPSEDLAARAGGTETVERLVGAMQAFATDSGFLEFYRAHRAVYAKVQERLNQAIARVAPADRLEPYYGTRFERYQILASMVPPREPEPGAIATEESPEGPTLVLRPVALTQGAPEFREATAAFSREVLHGLGRAFVNPVCRRAAKDLKGSEDLFTPIAEDMRSRGLDTWTDTVEEQILRAMDARLMQADGDTKGAQTFLRSNERGGFVYIREFFDQMAAYEGGRATNPTFEAFFPTLTARLSYLKDTGADQVVAQRLSSFQGPIDKATARRYAEAMVIVRPTPVDPKLQPEAEAYTETVRAALSHRMNRTIRVVTTEQAVLLDKANTAYVIVGTPWSNPFLAALMKYIPVKVSRNTIQLGGKQWVGQNLRLNTAIPNPYNPKLPMQILTATEESGITGILELPHGPNDYVLYHDSQVLAQGDFVYDVQGRWKLP